MWGHRRQLPTAWAVTVSLLHVKVVDCQQPPGSGGWFSGYPCGAGRLITPLVRSHYRPSLGQAGPTHRGFISPKFETWLQRGAKSTPPRGTEPLGLPASPSVSLQQCVCQTTTLAVAWVTACEAESAHAWLTGRGVWVQKLWTACTPGREGVAEEHVWLALPLAVCEAGVSSWAGLAINHSMGSGLMGFDSCFFLMGVLPHGLVQEQLVSPIVRQ